LLVFLVPIEISNSPENSLKGILSSLRSVEGFYGVVYKKRGEISCEKGRKWVKEGDERDVKNDKRD